MRQVTCGVPHQTVAESAEYATPESARSGTLPRNEPDAKRVRNDRIGKGGSQRSAPQQFAREVEPGVEHGVEHQQPDGPVSTQRTRRNETTCQWQSLKQMRDRFAAGDVRTFAQHAFGSATCQ